MRRPPTLLYELADLRSSLHAYVAPGQGIDFWSKRAGAQLDSLGSRLRDLEPAAAAANHSLSTALSSLDGLADSEKRARSAMRNSQPLVAGDIVFDDARDQIDAAARDLADARQAMSRAESAREAGMANEQSLLAGGLMAVWIFALIVLVPIPAAKPAEAAPSEPKELPRDKPADRAPDREELRLPMRAATPNAHGEPPPDEPVAPAPAVSDHDESQPGAPVVAPELTARVLDSIAELCTDLARVANLGELGPLLDRAAGVLQARGVVVWLVSPDGQHLAPAMAHGYDENQLARIGSIGIGDDNLTAAAFRTGHPTHASADAQFPGAVAVPILWPLARAVSSPPRSLKELICLSPKPGHPHRRPARGSICDRRRRGGSEAGSRKREVAFLLTSHFSYAGRYAAGLTGRRSSAGAPADGPPAPGVWPSSFPPSCRAGSRC